jgi:tRNA pseudouridine38-40 synthase
MIQDSRDPERVKHVRIDNYYLNESRRLICTCAYDGTHFNGWQTQLNGNTIQDLIESRLKRIFKVAISIAGSGRTDTGVHAKNQTFHFDLPVDPLPKYFNLKDNYTIQDVAEVLDKLLTGLHENDGLSPYIQILTCKASKVAGFHSRSNCTGKRYIYTVQEGYGNPFNSSHCWPLGKDKILDLELMIEASKLLIGIHDFSSFGVISEQDPRSPIKNMYNIEIERHQPILISKYDDANRNEFNLKKGGDIVTITAICDRFLYNMMRMISGTLISKFNIYYYITIICYYHIIIILFISFHLSGRFEKN